MRQDGGTDAESGGWVFADQQAPVQPAAEFLDAADSIFGADIAWLSATDLTNRCNPPDNDRFCPNDPVTRGQLAALLVRAMGYTDEGGGDLFVDDDGSIFEGATPGKATPDSVPMHL